MQGGQLFSRNLSYFMTLYQMLNYADAARAIPITYQGLKKSIEALEATVGAPLFNLGTNGKLVPTEYADLLHGLVRDWTRDARNLEEEFNRIRNNKVKTLGLGVATGASSALDSRALQLFSERYPGLALDVVEYADRIVDQMILDGDVDLAITAAPYSDELVTVPLIEFMTCVWMRRGCLLSNRESIRAADLAGQDVMLPDQHYKSHDGISDVISSGDASPRSIRYCSDTMSSFLFALSGRGVGMGVDFVGDRLRDVDNLVSLPFIGGPKLGFGVSYRKGYELSDNDRCVIDFLKEAFSKAL